GVIYRRLREIAEHGVAAAGDSPSARARLEEFRDVIAFIESELPRTIDRFFRERATAKVQTAAAAKQGAVPAAAGGKGST
ncbi:MAG: hypothetical protein ACJ765_14585, partial [Chloroflexota bacterium]